MENVTMNEKAVVIDELETVSGGMTPSSLATERCSVCGKHTVNLNLVEFHRQKVCKECIKKLNNEPANGIQSRAL